MNELEMAVREHLARMPKAARVFLEPAIGSERGDPHVREVLLAYLRYWTRLFERDESADDAEAHLADELSTAAKTQRSGDDVADVEAAEAVIGGAFRARGLAFLGGRTPPYFGAYVWSRTEKRRFDVALPRADPQPVTVHFLHDFLVRGWLHWRTFGRQGAGGWYKQDDPEWPDGLYAVADRYPDPETNRQFRVSLLGHEAQHVADHRDFPGLSSRELEYRAKLIEVIGYDRPQDRLEFFLADAADDPAQPHPWAAHRIISDLAARLPQPPPHDREAWLGVPYAEIRRHALDLLDADTARLQASG
jgi:hypothetical protein